MAHPRLPNGAITKDDLIYVAQQLAKFQGAELNLKHFDASYTICCGFGYIPTYVYQEAARQFKLM